MWISFIGVDFEVLEPPEMLEHLQRAHDRLTLAISRAAQRPAPSAKGGKQA
jgi:hypothetical protein